MEPDRHGHARRDKRTPEYITWRHMRKRCSERASGKERTTYLARGIKVCERWQSFSAFLSDMGPRPAPGYTIDRIDTDGDYEPGNCRWATATEQNRNRRDNVMTHVRGETLCLAAVAARYGLSTSTVHRRYHAGLRGEELIASPRVSGGHHVER